MNLQLGGQGAWEDLEGTRKGEKHDQKILHEFLNFFCMKNFKITKN